ncbi:EXS family protein/ERD1/XPR1/SYG1 family protein [Mycena leptocephala]|nr:EXS family protein/ERD1/XPR1/SYG1 family protein [Mycena leptocephala]
MKFAQYLEDTRTPEWQKAYIDYRLLKKRITAIRRAYGDQNVADSPVSTQMDSDPGISSAAVPKSTPGMNTGTSVKNPPKHDSEPTSSSPKLVAPASGTIPEQPPRRKPLSRWHTVPASIHSQMSDHAPSLSRMFSSSNSKITTRRFTKLVGPKPHPFSELPLRDLMPLLSPPELAFFSTLDAELDKIETFYLARENEMKIRTELLGQQLNELAEHRKLFNAAYPSGVRSAINASAILNFNLKAKLLKEEQVISAAKDKGKATAHRAAGKFPGTAASSSLHLEGNTQLDPDEFHDAKHKLKKAVLEHYRGLETLQNYRILNVTGIRKALKKFQKVTKIAAQNAYMSEKVDKTAFASEENVRRMMDEMEATYATWFAHGDKKRALNRLRSGPQHKSHHVSTFWPGLFVGLAVPALVSGLYHSKENRFYSKIHCSDPPRLPREYPRFHPGMGCTSACVRCLPHTRCLLGFSWFQSIGVVAIEDKLCFYIRVRSKNTIGSSGIFCPGLSYAFWLSFAQIGSPSISPTIWPLVWLAFAAVIMLAPFPFLFKPSRYWLLKNVGKLLASGTRRVEFADFWMGDQFCSLVFTLSNLYLVVCLYVEGFNSNWRECGSKSRFWPLAFALAILPFLVRLIQSIKRYVDSGLNTHMINAGKYGAGIVAYFTYFIWRHKGGYGVSFAVWVVFQAIYSLYALTWDLLMDWSILRLDVQYPLLRKEMVYSNHIYLYYFAIFSNTLIRFIWVLYIPAQGPDIMLRTFIGASFEMLRRWQWNFYRVENEHLGNMDQYRVTREVPLPYSLDERGDDADDDYDSSPSRTWFPERAIRLRRKRVAAEV